MRADEYPDMEWPQMESGRYQGVIAVGGLMLARIPEEIVEQRKQYFAQVTQDKDDAVANDPLKDQHPSMPVHNESRRSRISQDKVLPAIQRQEGFVDQKVWK